MAENDYIRLCPPPRTDTAGLDCPKRSPLAGDSPMYRPRQLVDFVRRSPTRPWWCIGLRRRRRLRGVSCFAC